MGDRRRVRIEQKWRRESGVFPLLILIKVKLETRFEKGCKQLVSMGLTCKELVDQILIILEISRLLFTLFIFYFELNASLTSLSIKKLILVLIFEDEYEP